MCWGREGARQFSEPERPPFPPARGLAALQGTFSLPHLAHPAFSSWLQASPFSGPAPILLLTYSFYSFIHTFVPIIQYLLSSSYTPGPY